VIEVLIRPERPEDFPAIHNLTQRAFAPMPFSAGDEQEVIERLRKAGALALSIVAEQDKQIVGHVAFSPAFTDGGSEGWFALGPISVEPSLQRRGVGTRLIRRGIDELRGLEAAGCILVGDLVYYVRHGFRPFPDLAPESEPAGNFMILPLRVSPPNTKMRFHPAFYGVDN
jgi:putative acetyltransferase